MYRRIVSLFLLPCLLLTQSAARGHSHTGDQPAGHDSRPHFHTAVPAAAHGRGGHDHGHAHHHPHTGESVAPGLDLQSAPVGGPESDHDSSAVFTGSVDLVTAQRSSADNDPAAFSFWAVAGLTSPAFAHWSHPPFEPACWPNPPPNIRHSCPLYVRHLALLI